MSSATYTLTPHDITFQHGPIGCRLHDHDNPHQGRLDRLAADALVASGDYFGTLATSLDSISQELAAYDEPNHIKLERLINTLLYLEQTYKITKKDTDKKPSFRTDSL
jgi:hypothetical protein